MTAQYEREYSESLGQHHLIWLIINHTHWHEKNTQTILQAQALDSTSIHGSASPSATLFFFEQINKNNQKDNPPEDCHVL